MKVKNNSARAYHVRGVIIAPGATSEVPNEAKADIKGMDDLEIVGKVEAEEVEFTETANMTKAELQAALDKKGVDYSATANKAELQALLDA